MTEDCASPRTIKSLVFDYIHRVNGHVSFDSLTAEVRRHFPQSKWQKTHWSWYRSQILRGRFRGTFSQEELDALAGSRATAGESESASGVDEAQKPLGRGPEARDPEIKRLGDAVLSDVREAISRAGGDDIDKRFKINRWVFSRLHQDEIRVKKPIKQKLWAAGMRSCQACHEPFESLKHVEIHRKDGSAGYSEANCELLCRECHKELD